MSGLDIALAVELTLALGVNLWLALTIRKALKPMRDAANQWQPAAADNLLKHVCHYPNEPTDSDGNLLVFECLGCRSRQFRVRWPGKPTERVG